MAAAGATAVCAALSRHAWDHSRWWAQRNSTATCEFAEHGVRVRTELYFPLQKETAGVVRCSTVYQRLMYLEPGTEPGIH